MLIDTSGLFALAHRGEPQHQAAQSLYWSTPNRLIHNYVLAEFVPLATVRGLSRDLTLEFSRRILKTPNVKVVWVDELLHGQALDLLFARSDKMYSLCDAVSFLLMRRFRLTDALTTDHHFQQEGFHRLLSD